MINLPKTNHSFQAPSNQSIARPLYTLFDHLPPYQVGSHRLLSVFIRTYPNSEIYFFFLFATVDGFNSRSDVFIYTLQTKYSCRPGRFMFGQYLPAQNRIFKDLLSPCHRHYNHKNK